MNLVINYDFFNAIRDVNEKFSGFKVIRNNKKKWVKYHLPIYALLDTLILRGEVKNVLLALFIQANLDFGLELVHCVMEGNDIYKLEAMKKLKTLVSMFEKINVDTSYDLLLQSELFDRITNININENKIPQLVESKYIIVPTFDYNGSLSDTCIKSKHVIGSDTYVLSKSKPSKVFKLAYKRV